MNDLSALPHNLRRLRDAKKLSQAQVAEMAKLSRIAYGNIETGSSSPKVGTLMRIAAALEVKLQDLFAPVRVLRAVRFRAAKKMTSREQLLAGVARWLDDYNELEAMLAKPQPYLPALAKVAKDHGRGSGDRRASEAAVAARKALGLRHGETIRDICGLLEDRCGIKVYPLPLASEGFFGLSIGKADGGPAIVVNVWDRISVERWIFTAAHELGHLLLHLDSYDVDRADEDDDQEREADRFASQFLMPPDVFGKEWDEARGLPFLERVFKVKRIFRVSYATVLYRLSERPEYGQKVWGWFQGAHKQQFERTLPKREEPAPLPPKAFRLGAAGGPAADEPKRLSEDDFVEDRLRRLVRQAMDEQKISLGRAAEILDLDLRAMRALAAAWVE